MNLLDDLMEAASEQVGSCKVCDALDKLTKSEAKAVDDLLRARVGSNYRVSSDKVATILKAHGTSVGSTTVRRHRTNCPPRKADAQS